MIVRGAKAVWNSHLKQGSGAVQFGDVEKPYSLESRFEEGGGTNPILSRGPID